MHFRFNFLNIIIITSWTEVKTATIISRIRKTNFKHLLMVTRYIYKAELDNSYTCVNIKFGNKGLTILSQASVLFQTKSLDYQVRSKFK